MCASEFDAKGSARESRALVLYRYKGDEVSVELAWSMESWLSGGIEV